MRKCCGLLSREWHQLMYMTANSGFKQHCSSQLRAHLGLTGLKSRCPHATFLLEAPRETPTSWPLPAASSPRGLGSTSSMVKAHDGAPASLSLLPFPPSGLTHLGAPGYSPHPAVHRRAIFVGSTVLPAHLVTFKVNTVDTVQRWWHKGPELVQVWDGRAGVR